MNRVELDGDVVKKPGTGVNSKCKYGIIMVASQGVKTKKQYIKCVTFDNEEIINKIKTIKPNDYVIVEGELNITTHTKYGAVQKDAEVVIESLQIIKLKGVKNEKS